MGKQVIALTTKRERLTIKIDGVAYELLEPEELKLKDALWMEKAALRIDSLMKQMQSEEGEAATEELADLIFRVIDVLMAEVPTAVRAKLSDIQKLSVIQAYMGLLKTASDKVVNSPLPSGEDGETSSLDSSAFTEET